MRKYHPSWLRHPRTTAEKRANQEGWERPNRRPQHLPDTYDDIWIRSQKGWKTKRKTQYKICGRGQKHTLYVDYNEYHDYRISELLKDNDVSYVIEDVYEKKRSVRVPVRQRVVLDYQPVYHYKYKTVKGENGEHKLEKVRCHQVGWKYTYDWCVVGYEIRHYKHRVGFNIVWWSNKDIGIEYILKQCKWRGTIT